MRNPKMRTIKLFMTPLFTGPSRPSDIHQNKSSSEIVEKNWETPEKKTLKHRHITMFKTLCSSNHEGVKQRGSY